MRGDVSSPAFTATHLPPRSSAGPVCIAKVEQASRKAATPLPVREGICTLSAQRNAIEQNVVSIGAQSAPSLVLLRAVAIVVLHGGLQGSSAGRLSKVESADGAGEEQSPE
jgi:hypothetical protein